MPFPLPLAVGAAFFLGGLMSLLPAMSSEISSPGLVSSSSSSAMSST